MPPPRVRRALDCSRHCSGCRLRTLTPALGHDPCAYGRCYRAFVVCQVSAPTHTCGREPYTAAQHTRAELTAPVPMPLARVHSRPHPRSARTPSGARTEFACPAQTRRIDAAPSPSPPSPSPTHIHTRAGRLFVNLPGLREFGVLKLEALGTAREGQAIERIGMKLRKFRMKRGVNRGTYRCEFIRDQFECTLAFVRGRRSDFDVCMSYLLAIIKIWV
ncbi:hypothetical protein B0H16DRAFT_1597332, partial [Mycena metata]